MPGIELGCQVGPHRGEPELLEVVVQVLTTRHQCPGFNGLHPVLKTPSLVFLWNQEVGHGETEVHTRVQA